MEDGEGVIQVLLDLLYIVLFKSLIMDLISYQVLQFTIDYPE